MREFAGMEVKVVESAGNTTRLESSDDDVRWLFDRPGNRELTRHHSWDYSIIYGEESLPVRMNVKSAEGKGEPAEEWQRWSVHWALVNLNRGRLFYYAGLQKWKWRKALKEKTLPGRGANTNTSWYVIMHLLLIKRLLLFWPSQSSQKREK